MLAGIIIHPYLFAPVFATLLYLTLSEFYRISLNINFLPQKIAGIISGILLFSIFFLVANNLIAKQFILVTLLIPFVILLAELFGKGEACFKNSSITLFGVVYVALPFGLLNFLIIPENQTGSKFYPWILVGVFFILWIYDSMAYLSGSFFGKHKICKKISPKKSWEGLIGGAVFAVIMGILNAVLFNKLSITNWIVIALLIVIFGTGGDFFESKLKRETGLKDSGNIMPGHGGMLDRFDSLLFAVPVIYIWLNLFGNI